MASNILNRRELIAGGAAAVAGATVAAEAIAQPQAGALPVPRRPDLSAGKFRVAFVVDKWINMIDLAGAWEVFQDSRVAPDRTGKRAFVLYTVGPRSDELYTTTGTGPVGLNFQAHYSFAEAPQPDVIMMGAQDRPDGEDKIAWIRHAAQGAQIVSSVCTGAFLLARTGLLDGLKATTHHEYWADFATEFPKVELVRGTRFVDNGKFITAGGLTSGIDAALHIVDRLVGTEQAKATAKYMEHVQQA